MQGMSGNDCMRLLCRDNHLWQEFSATGNVEGAAIRGPAVEGAA